MKNRFHIGQPVTFSPWKKSSEPVWKVLQEQCADQCKMCNRASQFKKEKTKQNQQKTHNQKTPNHHKTKQPMQTSQCSYCFSEDH